MLKAMFDFLQSIGECGLKNLSLHYTHAQIMIEYCDTNSKSSIENDDSNASQNKPADNSAGLFFFAIDASNQIQSSSSSSELV
jgi:hypothetical protein